MDNIIYLENTDVLIDEIISDLDIFKDKIVVVLVQSESCVICSDLKKKYNNLENKDNIVYTTIQHDGKYSSNIVDAFYVLLGIKTVPYFLVYDTKGKLMKNHKEYTKTLQIALNKSELSLHEEIKLLKI